MSGCCRDNTALKSSIWSICYVEQACELTGLLRWVSGWRIRLPKQETQETWVRSLGQEDPLEEEMATLSSILAWRIPRTEDPGGSHSMMLQKSQTGLSHWTWTWRVGICKKSTKEMYFCGGRKEKRPPPVGGGKVWAPLLPFNCCLEWWGCGVWRFGQAVGVLHPSWALFL